MTVTLITGANKGLGYETARRLIAEGHTVYIGARSVEHGEAAASQLGGQFVQLDVTDDASVEAALATIDEREGRLDVLVNNAGISTTADASGPVALQVFDTNAIGVIRVTQAALPLLAKSENPVVVNVSSALGSFWAVTSPERRQFQFPSMVYGGARPPSRCSPCSTQRPIRTSSSMPSARLHRNRPHPFRSRAAGGKGGRGHGAHGDHRRDGPTGTFQENEEELGW